MMGGVQPLNAFFCFPLDVGVAIILVLHILICVFYIITCSSNILLDIPSFGYNVPFASQVFNCGFSLASSPFVMSGVSGIKYGIEIHLRIYLWWFMFCVLLDTMFTIILMSKYTCDDLPAIATGIGASLACGFMRIGVVVFWLCYICVAFYAVAAIWSQCELLQLSSSAISFEKLLADGELAKEQKEYSAGLFGIGPVAPEPIPLAYGSLASQCVGGSVAIFGGDVHEIDFPPEQKT